MFKNLPFFHKRAASHANIFTQCIDGSPELRVSAPAEADPVGFLVGILEIIVHAC